MKKILLIVLVIVAMSCRKDDTIEPTLEINFEPVSSGQIVRQTYSYCLIPKQTNLFSFEHVATNCWFHHGNKECCEKPSQRMGLGIRTIIYSNLTNI